MKSNKVFLGGTCCGQDWRNTLIALIGKIEFFNPIVEDWTEECQQIEYDEKENKCNIHLYLINSNMKGVFSIAEAIDSVHNNNKYTILHIMPKGFDKQQLKSLEAVVKLIRKRGGISFISDDITYSATAIRAIYYNSHFVA